MGNNLLANFGILYLTCVLIKQIVIGYQPDRPGRNGWKTTVLVYKAALCATILMIFVLFAFMLFHFHRVGNDRNSTDSFVNLFEANNVRGLLIIGLVGAIVKYLLDEAFARYVKGRPNVITKSPLPRSIRSKIMAGVADLIPSLRSSLTKKPGLAWLAWSVLTAVVVWDYTPLNIVAPSSFFPVKDHPQIWFLAGCSILAVADFSWVILHTADKLSRTHGFRGQAIKKFVISPTRTELEQIIAIGPRGSGKSQFIATCIQDPAPFRTSEGLVFGGLRPTYWFFRLPDPRDRRLFSACDMPGENLGDHLRYMFQFRVDTLFIAIRASALYSVAPLDDVSKYTLAAFPTLCDAATEQGRDTRDYFTAVRLAFKSYIGPGIESPFRHKVRQIVIVLNKYDPSGSDDDEFRRSESVCTKVPLEGLKALATGIGQLVGLQRQECCHAFIAPLTTQGPTLLESARKTEETILPPRERPDV